MPQTPIRPDDRFNNPPAGTGGLLAGRYRLEQRIGRGGMADVYRAEDELLLRSVAVKLFRFDTAGGDERRRVDDEIRTLAALRNPGLVTVFDAGTCAEPGGTPFLVMELIDGPNLARRLADGPLTRRMTAQLGSELAATLHYVHANSIVHRDIKPANILLDDRADQPIGYTAKLTDFGIARLLDATRITMHGMTIGTANYLSPEQARGGEITPASDVYSLGLVLLECLSGCPAYPGNGMEAAAARLHYPPVIPPGLGAEWQDLLIGMTNLQPERRPDAAAVADRLNRLTSVAPITPAARYPARAEQRTERLPALGSTGSAPALSTGASPALRQTSTSPAVSSTGARRGKSRRALSLTAAAAVALLLTVLAIHERTNASSHTPAAAASHRGSAPPKSVQASRAPVPDRASTVRAAPTTAPVALTPDQAVAALRAAIARAVASGTLDQGAANDLSHHLDDLAQTLDKVPPPGAQPGHDDGLDARHKVAELNHQLADLARNGQLTPSGRQQLAAPLAALERVIPPVN